MGLIDFERELKKSLAEDYCLEECDITGWSTNKIKMISSYIGKEPKSLYYGKIIGSFTYDDRVFSFHYSVKYNNLESIEETILCTDKHNNTYKKHIDTNFGIKAAWEDTPDECLDDTSMELRNLIRNIQRCVEGIELYKLLKVTDK